VLLRLHWRAQAAAYFEGPVTLGRRGATRSGFVVIPTRRAGRGANSYATAESRAASPTSGGRSSL